MARAIWSGIVSFGMVSIPVKLHKATSERSLSFNLLHGKCQSRIEERRWCPVCEEEVEWEDLVRGFQYAKDQYVVLSEDDLRDLPLPSKKTVQVTAFVNMQEMDPVYFNDTYYLEPEKMAQKSYALLHEALVKKEMVALGTIALRTKERLCSIRPYGELLVVETLFYPDEIRIDETRKVTSVLPNPKELKMAEQLIDLMVEKFNPEDYKDHYREALEEVIEAKLNEEEITESKPRPKGKVIDLSEALAASLANMELPKKGGTRKKPAKSAAASTRKTKASAARTSKEPATARAKRKTTSRKSTTRKRKAS